jgi:hypothetical protein
MRDVLGPRNWVFWWATLTATVFLQSQLQTIADFFATSEFFNSAYFPFSLVSGLNAWINSVAQGIQEAVQFDPNANFISSPIAIPNWTLAVLAGVALLGVAVALYVRALKSSSLGDDVLTLFILYFILGIEFNILGAAQIGPFQGQGNVLIENPLIGFWILMFFLFVLIFMGGGLNSRRAFWRGLLEAGLIALFIVPEQTADMLALILTGLASFGTLLVQNPVVGVAWGIIGALLALTRLTSSSAAAKTG